MAEKPTGGSAFDDLARKLVQVPKREVIRERKRTQKARKKRREKK